MKKNYIIEDFNKTVDTRFPAQAEALRAAMQARLSALRAEYANAAKEAKLHLESQIMPGIAVYETLQTVLPKDEAVQTLHGYVEGKARREHETYKKLLRLPGLYRLIPGLFVKGTRMMFGEAAGFAAREIETSGRVWRIDMTKCPYHDACEKHGCPEICTCFCDSDDITYTDMHKRLIFHRTKTLGRGNDCCDFCLKIGDKQK